MNDPERCLAWAHGTLTVQRLGAMLAPVEFRLRDGRSVSPLHVAPWAGEAGTDELPGILRRLRGEWPCVPFGYSVPADDWPAEWVEHLGPPADDEEVHGHASNHDWNWLDDDGTALRLRLDYPAASPVAYVERAVRPDPESAAIDLTFRIVVRRPCRLPIGLHPVFRLPTEPGAARLDVGPFALGRTYPATVEPGKAVFAADRSFTDLAAVPARDGGSPIDATALPFGFDTEELLQIEGTSGRAALAHPAEGYRVVLNWDVAHFPSLLLWLSNRGRTASPWNGRHLAVGIEPISSPFGLGPATATADNPIARSGVATARSFSPDVPFETRYRLSAEAI